MQSLYRLLNDILRLDKKSVHYPRSSSISFLLPNFLLSNFLKSISIANMLAIIRKAPRYALGDNTSPAKKKAATEKQGTPTLATAGESIFEDSNHVLYINRGGWTTQRLLVQGKQSLWRRRKLK